jgi:hypothetical protein
VLFERGGDARRRPGEKISDPGGVEIGAEEAAKVGNIGPARALAALGLQEQLFDVNGAQMRGRDDLRIDDLANGG